jgi:hypothetical protein
MTLSFLQPVGIPAISMKSLGQAFSFQYYSAMMAQLSPGSRNTKVMGIGELETTARVEWEINASRWFNFCG